jgi:hypothetical protein
MSRLPVKVNRDWRSAIHQVHADGYSIAMRYRFRVSHGLSHSCCPTTDYGFSVESGIRFAIASCIRRSINKVVDYEWQ